MIQEIRLVLLSDRYSARHALLYSFLLLARKCAQSSTLQGALSLRLTRKAIHLLYAAFTEMKYYIDLRRKAKLHVVVRGVSRWLEIAHISQHFVFASRDISTRQMRRQIERWRFSTHGTSLAREALLLATLSHRRLSLSRALRRLSDMLTRDLYHEMAPRTSGFTLRRNHRLARSALRCWRCGESDLVRQIRQHLVRTRRQMAVSSVRRVWRSFFMQWSRMTLPRVWRRRMTKRRAVQYWSSLTRRSGFQLFRVRTLLADRLSLRLRSKLQLALMHWRRLLTDLPHLIFRSSREKSRFEIARGFVQLARNAMKQTRGLRSTLIAQALHLGEHIN